jgi:hypothetical protein
MTMRCWPAAVLLVLAGASAVADAGAQSLLETFRARRAQGQTADAPDSAAAELESGESPGGKFALPSGARVERDLAYGRRRRRNSTSTSPKVRGTRRSC